MNSRLSRMILAMCVFGVDRVTKMWIDAKVGPWDVLPVIPGFFNIIHSENRGMAFSLLADAPESVRSLVLVGISGAVLLFVAVMLWQAGRGLERLALTLVMGGAMGNLWDRIFRGSVTDFLDFYIGEYHWATFNVADSAITIGAILLAWEMLRSRRPAPSTPQGKAVS